MTKQEEKMMRQNKHNQRGRFLPYLVVGLLLTTALSDVAFGYAAIVKVPKTQISGATISLFGTKPSQTTTTGKLVEGAAAGNYTVDSTSDPQYTIYNVYDAPAALTYFLADKGTTYSIFAASGGTTVPITTTFTLFNYYKKGQPDAPTGLVAVAGFETAKLNWQLNDKTDGTGFEYSGIDLEISASNTYAPLLGTAISLGKSTEYKVGELIDTRKLEVGTAYYYRVRGKVDGVTPSNWATGTFNTNSGSALGPQTFKLAIQTNATGKPGINFISMGIAPDANNRWYAGTTPIANAYDLVKVIGTATGKKVLTFGNWDVANQLDAGIVIPNGNADDEKVKNDLLAITLKQGIGYQVYVEPPVPNGKVEITIGNQ
ncbi:hypothetical protein A2311_00380 [candidate division WOR-1 bacterium RIFOXYB2_FULL_48_7]|uniref:Uncharacterized protein n=1 Tax=candidate division WOR-1 bacterium RIFOXYB2_FULL_48_7 TaxID=1802583 RepID=A0A1F4TR95_UNCSA|nr:MAG: hypothetical protein A2311_00380 [candidate division WOR-1 bacterium RIFOXYB2_FULL_48_7]